MAPQSSASDPSAQAAALAKFPPSYVNYNHGGQLLGVAIAMLPLTAAAVAGRFWARKTRNMPWAVDDWLALASLVRDSEMKMEMWG
jgi:hypothetical protein